MHSNAMIHRAWEKPMDFVAGLAEGKNIAFLSLNLANDGQLPQLPGNAYIETGVHISDGQIVPSAHILPPIIVDKAKGRTALDECMRAHADLIGRW